MNVHMKPKQNHRDREEAGGCQWGVSQGRDGVGDWDQQMQGFIYGVDQQQGPCV